MARLRLRKPSDAPFAIQGPARVDRRTKDMIPRLQAGEIAVINLESASRRAWERFAQDARLPGIAAAIADSERLAAQFRSIT